MSQHRMSSADNNTKPPSPTALTKTSWTYLLVRTVQRFTRDQLIDKAAALTFFAVLSLFPALITVVSILGLVGKGQAATDTLMNLVDELAPRDTAEQLSGLISSIIESPGAGLGLVLGLLVALWTASNYVNAFSRASNGIYEVPEGRPYWKRRPIMYVLTALLVALVAIAAFVLVVSRPIAEAIGDVIGLQAPVVTAWTIVRWPLLALVAILIIALLYYFTPNVKQPKFRWVSAGAVVALLAATLATAALLIYINVMGGQGYNNTYGPLTGAIIFLLWLWIMNLMLLFGAELDAEMERVRELQSGASAEDQIQLPLRETTKIVTDRERYAKLLKQARALRRSEGETRAQSDGPTLGRDETG